mmetsp:Transcript_50566/g.130597  ORF Transcript_50566/g.130597 Transcript_50566/m.130597 type:complete len:212 (+) Transcript_50566:258-893(+)
MPGGKPAGGGPMPGGKPEGGSPIPGGKPTGGGIPGGKPSRKPGGKPEGSGKPGGKPEGSGKPGGKPEGVGPMPGGKPAGGKPAGGKPVGGNPSGGNPLGGKRDGGGELGKDASDVRPSARMLTSSQARKCSFARSVDGTSPKMRILRLPLCIIMPNSMCAPVSAPMSSKTQLSLCSLCASSRGHDRVSSTLWPNSGSTKGACACGTRWINP